MKKHTLSKGFSLIEIMVVLVIIGMLAAVVAPNVIGALTQGYKTRLATDFSGIKTALTMYKTENFIFPTTEQGIEALVSEPETDPKPRNWSGYLDKMPKDPWGNPYQYISPAEARPYDVYSLGADGVRGGEDEYADFSIWDDIE